VTMPLVELVRRLIAAVRPDQPHVDRGMAPVGDDGQQDVITLLNPASAGFDRLDAPREVLLIILEGRARLGPKFGLRCESGGNVRPGGTVISRTRDENITDLGT
jgi:hypothetical protein